MFCLGIVTFNVVPNNLLLLLMLYQPPFSFSLLKLIRQNRCCFTKKVRLQVESACSVSYEFPIMRVIALHPFRVITRHYIRCWWMNAKYEWRCSEEHARSPHSNLDITLYLCSIFSCSAQTGVVVYAVFSRGCHSSWKMSVLRTSASSVQRKHSWKLGLKCKSCFFCKHIQVKVNIGIHLHY